MTEHQPPPGLFRVQGTSEPRRFPPASGGRRGQPPPVSPEARGLLHNGVSDFMKLSLAVLTPGRWEGKVIPITLAKFLIGRDPDCHLRPASPAISKRHCALVVRGTRAF